MKAVRDIKLVAFSLEEELVVDEVAELAFEFGRAAEAALLALVGQDSRGQQRGRY